MSKLDKDRERFVTLARYKVTQLDVAILAAEGERAGFQAVIDAAEPTRNPDGEGIES